MLLTEFHLTFEFGLDQIWEKDASEVKRQADREKLEELLKLEDELS